MFDDMSGASLCRLLAQQCSSSAALGALRDAGPECEAEPRTPTPTPREPWPGCLTGLPWQYGLYFLAEAECIALNAGSLHLENKVVVLLTMLSGSQYSPEKVIPPLR